MNQSLNKHWLHLKRIRFYYFSSLILFLIITIRVILGSDFVEPRAFKTVVDFRTFWSASYLAMEGKAVAAYDPYTLSKVWHGISPYSKYVNTVTSDLKSELELRYWLYPPTFYLVIFPLSLMPLFPSLLIYITITLSGYIAVLRQIIRGRDAMMCLAAFPAVWLNLRLGQNGFLVAALSGAALLNLERRPLIAGVFIGLLSIKPHLVLLFPVALIAIGSWQTFFMALGVVFILMLLSVEIFGSGILPAWLNSLEIARHNLEYSNLLHYSPSVFASLRILEVPLKISYFVHFFVAISVAIILWKLWRNCLSWPIRNAALITSTLLMSPHIMDYDLASLALPIAWVAKLGIEEGWLSGEREILFAAWLLPILISLIGMYASIQIGPFVLIALLGLILRRAKKMYGYGAEAT